MESSEQEQTARVFFAYVTLALFLLKYIPVPMVAGSRSTAHLHNEGLKLSQPVIWAQGRRDCVAFYSKQTGKIQSKSQRSELIALSAPGLPVLDQQW